MLAVFPGTGSRNGACLCRAALLAISTISLGAPLGAQAVPLKPGLVLDYAHKNFDKPGDSELLVWINRMTDSETVFGSEFTHLMGKKGRAVFEERMSRREFLGARDLDYGRGGLSAATPEHHPHAMFMLSQRLLRRVKDGDQVDMLIPIILLPSEESVLVPGSVQLVPPTPEMQELIIDGSVRRLPTVHVRGEFNEMSRHLSFTADLWFLDDTAGAWITQDDSRMHDDESKSFHMALGSVVTSRQGEAIENALLTACRATIYGFYFAFNSADLDQTSVPTFAAVSGMLAKHPDWTLTIEGHTDSIGSISANKVLSERRAASVQQELVSQYHIAPARLSTAGAGASGFIAPNATLQGRARNRRVDLVRRCGGSP